MDSKTQWNRQQILVLPVAGVSIELDAVVGTRHSRCLIHCGQIVR
jgi:hypothetical protein